MRRALIPHPQCPTNAVSGIEVEILHPDHGVLALKYVVTGAIEVLKVPAWTSAARANGLWRHTCFEAFLAGAGRAYRELNFAPSGQWAAYAFAGYREDMRDAALACPRIETLEAPNRYELRARLVIDDWLEQDTRLGLSAVIEEKDGRKSYWALAHPPGPSDFHHPDCFTLELPPPATP